MQCIVMDPRCTVQTLLPGDLSFSRVSRPTHRIPLTLDSNHGRDDATAAIPPGKRRSNSTSIEGVRDSLSQKLIIASLGAS